MNKRKHDINTILQASRMLFFQNKDKNHEYTIGGSAFLIKVNDFLFAVTAKHVLENNDYSPNDVLIRYNEESRHFLPFDDLFGVNTTDTDDTDHKDILFLKVAKSHFKSEIDTGFVIELPHKRSLPKLDCDQLLITGFPKEISEIDYDIKHIKTGRKPLMATKPNYTEFKGLLTFQYAQNNAEGWDLNGLSGSPVFCLDDKNHSYRIEGMLVRRNFYLSIDIISQYLYEIINKI
jgi:hypothetical protein